MRNLFFLIIVSFFNLLFTDTPDFSKFKVTKNITHKFYTLTDKDGLADNFISDIFQDKFGYMWFATANGLTKYNGYEFENFRTITQDTSSISNNFITRITEDIYGILWIGTSDGLNKYNRKTNTFKRYFNNKHNNNSLSDNFVRALYADKNGILWIDTNEGFLNEYDITQNKFTHYLHKKNNSNYTYSQIYEDSQKYLWIGGRGLGPYKFDRKTKKLKLINWDNTNSISSKEFTDASCFLEDSKGNFWIGDGARRLVILENIETEKTSNCKFASPYTIMEDNKHNIWVGGWSSGAYKYDLTNKTISVHRYRENDKYSIANNKINKIFQDKSGVLWFGTQNGISMYAPKKDIFEHFKHIPNEKKSLSSNIITSIIEDQDSIIWIGTMFDGLDKVDRKNNSITNYYYENDSTSLCKISCLYENKSTNDIYIGLWLGEGFDKFNKKTEKFTRYRYKKKRTSDWYQDFLETDSNKFLVGLWGPGIIGFDRRNGKFTKRLSHSEFNYGYITNQIYSIYYDKLTQKLWYNQNGINSFKNNNRKMELGKNYLEDDYSPYNIMCLFDKIHEIIKDENKNLWFCANNKILKYNSQNNKFSYFQFKKKSKNSFISLNCIYFNKDNNILYIGSEEGIIEFDINSSKYTFLNIFNISITKIKKEKQSLLWIGTNNGLYLYNFSNKQILKKYCHDINLKRSLSSNKITEIYKDLDNKLWIGTENGLNILNNVKQTFTRLKNTSKNSISSNFITSIFQNSIKYLWIGTDNGLNRFDLQNNIWTNFKNDIKDTTSIINDKIYSIVGNKKNIWIGTGKGLCKYNCNDKFIQYTKPNDMALSARLTKEILKDKNGNIWITSSNMGLNLYNFKTKKFKYFRNLPYDSTSINSNNITAIFEDSKGIIWVGANGLNRYKSKAKQFCSFYNEKWITFQ